MVVHSPFRGVYLVGFLLFRLLIQIDSKIAPDSNAILKWVQQLGTEALCVRVSTASVVVANYPLIREDFPFLKEKSEEEIDQWLIEEAGYIAVAQLNARVKFL